MAAVILYTERFFHCCNCTNSKIISSVITIHILKTDWLGNSFSPNEKEKIECISAMLEETRKNYDNKSDLLPNGGSRTKFGERFEF